MHHFLELALVKLHLYRHLWGVEEPLPQSFSKIKALGYSGIETSVPCAADKEELRDLLQEHRFSLIGQISTRGHSVREHLDSFRSQIEESLELSPVLINSHSGADRFSSEQTLEFFGEALEIEKACGIPIAHETHRGRIFYNPWITRFVLDRFPEVKVCADFSHWVCICERLLQTEMEIIQQVAEHTVHLHARVGYEQGPQVPDPRAPEYADHLNAHEHWWDLVWKAQQRHGAETSTLTPEFGPPGYLHTLPYTNKPVADLWDVCNWQADRQRDRFSKQFGI